MSLFLVFTIESNVAIPAPITRGRKGEEKYPFSKLEVKQSFFVSAVEGKDNVETAKTLKAAAYNAEKKLSTTETSVRFTVRPVENGARVWRTE